MGLELAEFFIEIEDHFDVPIFDDDSNPFGDGDLTVAMVIDFVERKIREKETPEIMAADFPQKAFDRTKATLARFAQCSQDEILPDSQLTDLFADPKRWRDLWQEQSEETLPIQNGLFFFVDAIKLRKTLEKFLVCWGASSIFILFPLLAYILPSYIVCLILAVYAFFSWQYCLLFIIKRIQHFAPKNVMVQQLADVVTGDQRRFLAADGSPLSRAEIEDRIVCILADVVGVKPDDIMLSDRLVQDLKMG
jgi:hypothetical protein